MASIAGFMERGVKLGAEVPYMSMDLCCGTAIARGIGEVLTTTSVTASWLSRKW